MSDLDQRFSKAQTDVKTLTSRPDNDTMLKLYSLYKQGSNGDVTGKRPGALNFVARAKFDAWQTLQGTSQDDAKTQYIALVEQLLSGA